MSALSNRVAPLRRETLQDGVYQRLCQLILEGGLVPGQSITVASLAEAFDVSPMPVREALTRLMSVGALTVVSGRTIGIPKLSREHLDDLRRVRLEVEPTAARWAAEAVEDNALGALEGHLRRLKESEERADTTLYVASNYDFHFTIYRQSRSPLLTTMIENLWLQISPYFHLLRESGNFAISNEQHEAMFEGMRTADPKCVAKAIKIDIESAYETLSRLI